MAMPEETERFRPLVQIAVFCQTALQEANGLISIIRIMERIQLVGQTSQMQPANIQLTLVVIFKSGFMRSMGKIAVRPNTPSGTQLPPIIETSAFFEGDERGVQMIVPMIFPANEEGLYWFDVLVDGEVFTRIPLRVMYQRIQFQGLLPPGMTPPIQPGS